MGLPWIVHFSWFSGFLINSFLILMTLSFELFFVLPEIHSYGPIYCVNAIFAIFVCFNIISNLLACSIVNTSIESLDYRPPKDSLQHASWHFCRKCEVLVPSRSWHCEICEICILKRDHHCVFVGRCIGHRNCRFFIMFLFYVAVGTIYSTIYNSFYVWWLHSATYANYMTVLKLFLPILVFWKFNWQNAFLFTYGMNIIFAITSCGFLGFYLRCFSKGATIYEFRKGNSTYDQGTRKRNFEMVLGKRMCWIWLMPFIKSELSHDGVNWEKKIEEIPLTVI